jgi:hypothetical protein
MFESGGIGAQIDRKVGALTGNPQAMQQLQQKQKTQQGKGVTPDLLDALALQKVMSDKALAKQQLALSQQQDAGTVVEQMEQKLVGMNKEELTAQTAGIMGERNKKRQQQVSSGKPPQATGQRPPMQMAQGAPQGLPAAPRPPMQMAQGGIIGYAAGDKVEAKGSRLEQALKAIGISYKDYMAMRPEQKKGVDAKIQQEYIKQRKEFTPTQMPISAAIDKAMVPTPERVASDAAAKANYDKKQSTGELGLDALLADKSLMQEEKDQVAAVDTQTAQPPAGQPPAGQPPAGQPPAGFGASSDMSIDQQLQSVLNTSAPDTNAIDKKQLSTALGDSFMGKVEDRIEVNPEAKSEATLARLASDDVEKGGYGTKKYEAGLAKYLKQKEDLDAAQLDPAAVEKERANAGIRGLISGGTSRGASIAKGKFDANVSQRRRDVITEQRDMYVKNKEATSAVLDKINAGASDALKLYKEDVSRGMDLMANITKADMTLYQTEADRMYNQNQNGIKNKIDALKVSSQANLQKMIQEQASVQELSVALKGLINANTDLRTEYFKALGPEQTGLNSIIYNKKSTPAEIKLAQGQLKAMEGTYQVLEDKTRTDDMITIYEDFIKMLRDQGGYSNTMVTQIQNQISQTLGTSQGTSQGASQRASQSASKGGTAQQRADILAPPPTD